MTEPSRYGWDDAINAVHSLVFLHDGDYRILRANRAYLEWAGASTEEEVIGRPYWEVFPRGDGPLPACRRAMEQLGAGSPQAGDGVESSEEIELPSGEIFRSRSYTVREADGSYRCSVHILEDITEQRRLEQARQGAEAKVKAIAAAARDAIVLIDDDDRLVYCNAAFEALLGYEAGELVGSPFHEQVAPSRYRTSARTGMRRFRVCGGGAVIDQRTEIEALHRDGHEVPLELSVSPLQLDGRWHAVGVMRDISERRALEVDRQRAEADRNIFLAAISHDLRTPLNAIVGFTDLLARSELDTEQRHHVGLCRSASQTLLGLIDTVLELSRLEAGRVELRDERFNLPAFLTTQIGLLQPMAEEKGLSLIWSLEPDMPGWVRGDPVRFGQVLYNLVSNALKFTETGSIRVDGARSTCGRLMFTVADTGPGIPEADQGRIFDAFCQGGPVLARKEGSGLGLKICQELVRLMGGTIQLVSTPGVGTTFRFTVTLPSAEPDRAEAAAVPQEAVDTEAPVGQGLWVLVAEDDPTNALLFQKLLEQAGCHVTVVGNGREAVRHWQRASPDLVLMDLQMPEVDGREATRRIRAREAEDWLPRTPIALVTAHALDSFQQECFRIGCDAYLTKPLDRAELWQLLARVRAA